MAGARPALAVAKGKIKGGGRLWLCGVDTLKASLFNRLQQGHTVRFSQSLEPSYYEQLAAERRVVRYARGLPIRRFERISGGARAEALDCLIYATAARSSVHVQLEAREEELRLVAKAATSSLIRSDWMRR